MKAIICLIPTFSSLPRVVRYTRIFIWFQWIWFQSISWSPQQYYRYEKLKRKMPSLCHDRVYRIEHSLVTRNWIEELSISNVYSFHSSNLRSNFRGLFCLASWITLMNNKIWDVIFLTSRNKLSPTGAISWKCSNVLMTASAVDAYCCPENFCMLDIAFALNLELLFVNKV